MEGCLIKGGSFGLTSGIITTLGLMMGLYSGTHSKIVVVGGIITIAIADSFSDALGMHISEESENKHTEKEIWVSTFATLISKFLFAIIFLIPVLLMELKAAIVVSVIFGLTLLCILSYAIAVKEKWRAVAEHLIITVFVLVVTHYAGNFISVIFAA